MNKILMILSLAIVVPSIYAQSPTSTDPSAPKSRGEVKSEIPRSGAPGTELTEGQNPPKTNSSKSRGQVKSEIPRTGAPGTEQTEFQDPSKKGSGK